MTVASAILLASTAVSLLSLIPVPESIYGRDRHVIWAWPRVDDTVRLIDDALFPLPNVTLASPWNSNLVEAATRLVPIAGHYIPVTLGIGIVVLALFHFRKSSSLQAALLGGTLMMLALIYVEYTGGYRHHGHIFVLLLALMWMHHAKLRHATSPEWFTAILTAQMIAGVYFVSADIARPFSDSRLIVRYLAQQPSAIPIVAAQPTLLNYEGPEIAAYLRRHVYYATAGGIVQGSYMWYDRARGRDADEGQIVNEIDHFTDSISSDVLVVTSHWDPKAFGQPVFAPKEPTLEGDEKNSAVYLYRHRAAR